MRKSLFSTIHLDPLDAGDHLSQLADGEGEEEGDGEPEDVEHREAEEGRLCRHNLKNSVHKHSVQLKKIIFSPRQ